ncbi:hypothetical protein ACRDU6_25495 [Mycolicibacterium sp. ELW1]|uniref:hypothetical protein n=1 Tax=Mycobacteriaceae TaxID=1762 RepID=UPI0011EE276C|nr:hypothetical protein [Mycobacterium sp. ELW1]QEN15592.1 hypothetical protein D3H54_22010 [Mycobacterium sp. ELW1]
MSIASQRFFGLIDGAGSSWPRTVEVIHVDAELQGVVDSWRTTVGTTPPVNANFISGLSITVWYHDNVRDRRLLRKAAEVIGTDPIGLLAGC